MRPLTLTIEATPTGAYAKTDIVDQPSGPPKTTYSVEFAASISKGGFTVIVDAETYEAVLERVGKKLRLRLEDT